MVRILFFVLGMAMFLLTTSCDYIPSEEFQIKTVDGPTITLLCPVVDPHRSGLTYFIDSDCVIIGVSK